MCCEYGEWGTVILIKIGVDGDVAANTSVSFEAWYVVLKREGNKACKLQGEGTVVRML